MQLRRVDGSANFQRAQPRYCDQSCNRVGRSTLQTYFADFDCSIFPLTDEIVLEKEPEFVAPGRLSQRIENSDRDKDSACGWAVGIFDFVCYRRRVREFAISGLPCVRKYPCRLNQSYSLLHSVPENYPNCSSFLVGAQVRHENTQKETQKESYRVITV